MSERNHPQLTLVFTDDSQLDSSHFFALFIIFRQLLKMEYVADVDSTWQLRCVPAGPAAIHSTVGGGGGQIGPPCTPQDLPKLLYSTS